MTKFDQYRVDSIDSLNSPILKGVYCILKCNYVITKHSFILPSFSIKMVARNLSLMLKKKETHQPQNSFRNKITIKKDGIIVQVGFVIKIIISFVYMFIWYTKISI